MAYALGLRWRTGLAQHGRGGPCCAACGLSAVERAAAWAAASAAAATAWAAASTTAATIAATAAAEAATAATATALQHAIYAGAHGVWLARGARSPARWHAVAAMRSEMGVFAGGLGVAETSAAATTTTRASACWPLAWAT